MNEPESLRHLIGKHLDAGLDADAAADAALADLDPEEREAWLQSLATQEAKRIQRSRTHAVEQRVRTAMGAGADPVKSRRKLLDEGFVLPTGEYVAWLLATPGQHRERAGWLRGQAAAVVETAVQHEDAAEAIESAGGTCLADLDPILRPGDEPGQEAA